MYKYLDRPPVTGDVVELQDDNYKDFKRGHIAVVTSHNDNDKEIFIKAVSSYSWSYTGGGAKRWKVIATKPGSFAKPGDAAIRIEGNSPYCPLHSTFIVQEPGQFKDYAYYSKTGSILFHQCLVLCKADEPQEVTCHSQHSLPTDLYYIQDAISQSIPHPNSQQHKEPSMNSLQSLLTLLFGAEKPTTDYDKRTAILVVAYDRDGSQIGTATATSIEAVKEKVANTPELWGCKVLTYSLDLEVTVKVPVKASKAKLVTTVTPVTPPAEDE